MEVKTGSAVLFEAPSRCEPDLRRIHSEAQAYFSCCGFLSL